MARFAFWKGTSELGGEAGLQGAKKPIGADGVFQVRKTVAQTGEES